MNNIRHVLIWILVNVCRFILAGAFIFSGFVKLIDPRGTEYKIHDYGEALGFSFMLPLYVPLVFSVLLALFEFCMGVYMLFGSRRLRTTRLLLAFLTLVTPLTLYLALTDKIHDCGCFGDAWVMSNWQTFGKNCVLWLACLVTALNPQRMPSFISERSQWMISLYVWIYAFGLALTNLYGLPLLDFRPYHIGADLMQVRSAQPSFETFFLMRKGNEEREFTLQDYPDSTWTLLSTRTVESSEGTSPAYFDDLVITSLSTNDDVTDSLLMREGYKFLLVLPDITEADDGAIDRIASLADYCESRGYAFWCFTAGSDEQIQHWKDLTGAVYPFYRVDDVVLKTMIRSNPGLILLRDSEVVNKWPSTNLPNPQELNMPLEELKIAHPTRESHAHVMANLSLWFMLPLLVWIFADRLNEWRKHRK